MRIPRESIELPSNPQSKIPYALVNLATAKQARAAISKLNGTNFSNHRLVLRLVRGPDSSTFALEQESLYFPRKYTRPSTSRARQQAPAKRRPSFESIYVGKMNARHMLQDVTVNGFPDVKVHLKHPVPTHETTAHGYEDHNIPSKLKTWYATENGVRRQSGKAPLSFILADSKATW